MGLNDFNLDSSDASGGSANDDLAHLIGPVSDEAKAAAKTRRNNIILAALALVGVGVCVKQFALGPKSATAAPGAAEMTSGPVSGASGPGGATGGKNSTVEQFLAGGAGDIKAARELLRHTEQVVETFKKYPTVNQVPLVNLKTNPFQPSGAARVDLTEEELKAKKAQERAAVLAAAQTLQLQSVLHSKIAPACLMNNTLLREQQEVNGFVVERIKPKSVIVHRGIYRFEVRLLR